MKGPCQLAEQGTQAEMPPYAAPVPSPSHFQQRGLGTGRSGELGGDAALAATPPARLPCYFPIPGASLPREGLTLPLHRKARANKSKQNHFLLFFVVFLYCVGLWYHALSIKHVRDYSFSM